MLTIFLTCKENTKILSEMNNANIDGFFLVEANAQFFLEWTQPKHSFYIDDFFRPVEW